MELKLSEEFVLIALDDARGKFITDSISLHYGLAGALLLDLALLGRTELNGTSLVITDDSPVNDTVLESMMSMLRASAKTRTVKYWIRKAGTKGRSLKNEVLAQLIEKKILVKEKDTFLWIFPVKKYMTQDFTPENIVKERLKKIVLNNEPADERSMLLLSLIDTCKLVKEVFRGKEEYKTARKRIKELTRENMLGNATTQVIRNMHAAIAASIAATTVAASAASSN